MNPAHAARDHVIALLTLLPARLGGSWPLDDTGGPDTAAWRVAENMAVTLRIGAQEFTFLHSLEAALSACLFFVFQALFVLVESAIDVRKASPGLRRTWTLGLLALSSPLFVDPALRVLGL